MTDTRRLKTGLIDLSKGKCTIPEPVPAGSPQTTLFELTTPKTLKSLLPCTDDRDQRGREQDATGENARELAKCNHWVKVTTTDLRAFYWSPKSHKSQWELPHELSGVRKKTIWQQFTCKGGSVKWFDTVDRTVSLEKPRALESHEERKERIKKEAKAKARASRVAGSQQLFEQYRRPKSALVPTKQFSLHEGSQKLVRGMKNSPMRTEVGEAQVRVSTSGLYRTDYLYSPATEEHELGTLIESGLDPCVSLNTNSPSLQESLLMWMTKEKTGIKIPKVVRLRLKAWYERNYFIGKYAWQKAYKNYLWEHRANRHMYFPARHAGRQQSGEFKTIVKAIVDQVKRLRNGQKKEEIADHVGFLFLGELDRNSSVNVQAWNFEAFDVSTMTRTPYHPTPPFPDYDHVDLVEYFSPKNVRNTIDFVKQLPSLLEVTELELVVEELEEIEEVVPIDFRWVSRRVKEPVQSATDTTWSGHGLEWGMSYKSDRKLVMHAVGVVPFDSMLKMEESNGGMPDGIDNVDLSSGVYPDADMAGASSVLVSYESFPTGLSLPSGINLGPKEDVTAGQAAHGACDTVQTGFDPPTNIEPVEVMTNGRAAPSTYESFLDKFFNDFDPPSTVYSREERDSW